MATTEAQPDYIRDANVRYHDMAAEHYDAKWGIDYGEPGQAQVTAKLHKALGVRHLGRFPAALEIGAGTGYFGLNLVRAGMVREYTATDISPGMVGALEASAARLGVPVRARCCEAAELPFPDDSFDLVFGHAVLHHLPDLEASFREFLRVLRPGGAIAFCGEPSHYGDRIAALPKQAAYRGGARLAGPDARRARHPRGLSPHRRRGRAGADRGRARVHAGDAARRRRRRRLRPRAGARRGAGGQHVRLGQPGAGGHRRAVRRAVAVAPVRLPRLPGLPGAGPRPARAAPARRRCSTTCWSRAAPA